MRTSILATAIAVTVAMSQTPGWASTLTFTDRTSFEAQAGPFVIETLNGITTDQRFNGGNVVAVPSIDLTISGVSLNPSNDTNIVDSPADGRGNGFGAFSRPIDGTTHIAFRHTGRNDELVLSFGTPIFAFGADFKDVNEGNPNQNLTKLTVNGEVFKRIDGLGSVTNNAVVFFGLIFQSPVSELRFARDFRDDEFGIDNLTVTPFPSISAQRFTAAVPLPAGLPLALTACAAIGWLGRKRTA